MREVYLEEGMSTPPKPKIRRKMVGLTQYMCQNVELSMDLGWKIPLLIPKGKIDSWGIGLLETL